MICHDRARCCCFRDNTCMWEYSGVAGQLEVRLGPVHVLSRQDPRLITRGLIDTRPIPPSTHKCCLLLFCIRQQRNEFVSFSPLRGRGLGTDQTAPPRPLQPRPSNRTRLPRCQLHCAVSPAGDVTASYPPLVPSGCSGSDRRGGKR